MRAIAQFQIITSIGKIIALAIRVQMCNMRRIDFRSANFKIDRTS